VRAKGYNLLTSGGEPGAIILMVQGCRACSENPG
jgi:hypothetical protein